MCRPSCGSTAVLSHDTGVAHGVLNTLFLPDDLSFVAIGIECGQLEGGLSEVADMFNDEERRKIA